MTIPRLDPGHSDDLPPIIYHYTTPVGLLGIIQGQVIWAGHISHLNDEREVTHARELIDDVTAWLHDPREDGLETQVAHLRGAIQTMKPIHDFTNFFVASFSSEWNSLSQWARYAGSGGYAVGIDPEFFLDEGSRWIEKVNYDRDDQLERMKRIVNSHLALSRDIKQDHMPAWGIEVGSQLIVFGLSCKSEGFKEEKEWRIVKAIPSNDTSSIRFRPGQFGVIPYHEIVLLNEEWASAIREIVIGPTRYGDDSVRAIELLLKAHGLEDGGITIRESKIPIR